MTTDERELERDLERLAHHPHVDDERLRLAIRATLREELLRRPKARRRNRLALGSALAAATAAAAVVVLIGNGGSGGPSSANAAILAHVARVMSPPLNLIVHVKESGVQPDGTPVSVEWWQETNPPYAVRIIKGASNQAYEGSRDGTSNSLYDPATNTIHQQASSKSLTLTDPVETVRAELGNGTANIAGPVTIESQSLYKIALPNGVIGYFDQSDYRPVYLDNPQGDGTVVRTHVLVYEELPLTSENKRLLSVTAQHPNAKVETDAAPTK
jgi:hypothetical protein